MKKFPAIGELKMVLTEFKKVYFLIFDLDIVDRIQILKAKECCVAPGSLLSSIGPCT